MKLSPKVKVTLVIILSIIGILVFGYNECYLQVAQKLTQTLLKMWFEFISRDVVGIV